MKRIAILALILGSVTRCVLAEAPDVVSVFPAGGCRGTDVFVRILDSKGARRGKGRRKPNETQPAAKPDLSDWRLWGDTPGIELANSETEESLILKVAADVPLGTHWLRFHNAEGASALRPFLVGTLPELPEVEPNDMLSQAQALPVPSIVINGVLEKGGEVDCYSLPLKSGQVLVASLAARQALGSPMDGVLQVVDPRGFVVEQNDDQRGFDSRIVYQVPRDGTYVVRTFAYPAAPDTNIGFSGAATYIYRLSLVAGPAFDRVFPQAVTIGQPASVRPAGWNLPDPAPAIELSLATAGLHVVPREGWDSSARVLATPYPVLAEVEPNSVAVPQAVAVPQSISGIVGEPGDVDGWKLTASAGQRVSLNLTATALGSSLDAVVRIQDSAGKILHDVDDAVVETSDIQLIFAAPQAGDYAIQVTDRFGHGGSGYGYVLTLSPEVPAAVLTVAADNFTIKAESPLEIPVTVERRGGLSSAVAIQVTGLPDGLTAETVVSEPKGDSAKSVKLVIKSTKTDAWSGPIRIAGKSENATEEWPAQFVTATSERVPHLWLTALPKP